MAESTINLRANLDTSGVEQGFSRINQQIGSINNSFVAGSQTPSMISSPGTPAMQSPEQRELEVQKISTIDDTNEMLKALNDTIKILIDGMNKSKPDNNPNPGPNPNPDPDNNNPEKRKWQLNGNGILGLEQSGINYGLQYMRGNVMGATGSALGDAGKGLSSIGQGLKGEGMAALGAAAGTAGIVALIGSIVAKGIDAASRPYDEILENNTAMNSAFNARRGTNSAQQNAEEAMRMFQKASSANIAAGTGMSNNEFLSYVSGMGKYGYSNADRAIKDTADMARWSRYTGADMSQVQNFAGTMSRYTGESADKSLTQAYNAMKLSGMAEGQFSEFLNGLESVIESGISKGYIESTEDVAEKLAYLGEASGNSKLWTGQQGAQRLMQMGAGLSAATSLSNTSQVLAYQAMKTTMGADTPYYEIMAAMEKTPSGKYLKNLNSQLDTTYGNDTAGKLETIRQVFGVNYSGAKDIMGIFNSGANETEIARRINAVKNDVNNKDDRTKQMDAINEINKNTIDISKAAFNSEVHLKAMAAELSKGKGGTYQGDIEIDTTKTTEEKINRSASTEENKYKAMAYHANNTNAELARARRENGGIAQNAALQAMNETGDFTGVAREMMYGESRGKIINRIQGGANNEFYQLLESDKTPELFKTMVYKAIGVAATQNDPKGKEQVTENEFVRYINAGNASEFLKTAIKNGDQSTFAQELAKAMKVALGELTVNLVSN